MARTEGYSPAPAHRAHTFQKVTRNRTGGLEDSGKWDSPSRVPSMRCRSLEEGWALWRDSSTSESASPISARNSHPPELTSRKVPCQSHARHACSTRHSRRIQLAARSLGLLHTSFVGAKASRGDLTAEGQADSGPLTGFEKVAPSRVVCRRRENIHSYDCDSYIVAKTKIGTECGYVLSQAARTDCRWVYGWLLGWKQKTASDDGKKKDF
ncbi:predicted protein [Histoplasma capsulatum var. duboisii H88]|uniref:Predicted protein n=2 Tax=Ajellomyces capsulatus TaxID=5037 RepID=F0UKZ2_AJEC8|nr:predicted protein [Histoplasma capsulatum H143]EGC46096.1 predicted protein [Histoplasma capsulatum var. duboisii H88]